MSVSILRLHWDRVKQIVTVWCPTCVHHRLLLTTSWKESVLLRSYHIFTAKSRKEPPSVLLLLKIDIKNILTSSLPDHNLEHKLWGNSNQYPTFMGFQRVTCSFSLFWWKLQNVMVSCLKASKWFWCTAKDPLPYLPPPWNWTKISTHAEKSCFSWYYLTLPPCKPWLVWRSSYPNSLVCFCRTICFTEPHILD